MKAGGRGGRRSAASPSRQAQLDTDRDDLDKTTVVAPMDGVVTSLPKEEGEMVIGAQSFSPTVIMTVADLSVMEVRGPGRRDRHPQRARWARRPRSGWTRSRASKIKGEVTEIGSSAIPRGPARPRPPASQRATPRNQAKDFKVTVTLKDPPPTLRPGLNATADITTDAQENVLAVPIQAVVVREVDKEGKVVDPDAAPGRRARATPVAQVGPRRRARRRRACSWSTTGRRSSGR